MVRNKWPVFYAIFIAKGTTDHPQMCQALLSWALSFRFSRNTFPSSSLDFFHCFFFVSLAAFSQLLNFMVAYGFPAPFLSSPCLIGSAWFYQFPQLWHLTLCRCLQTLSNQSQLFSCNPVPNFKWPATYINPEFCQHFEMVLSGRVLDLCHHPFSFPNQIFGSSNTLIYEIQPIPKVF